MNGLCATLLTLTLFPLTRATDMADGTLYILEANQPDTVFHCPGRFRGMMRQVGWAYCKSLKRRDCKPMWTMDGYDLKNSTAIIENRLGIKDVKISFNVVEPPPNTCGWRNMSLNMTFDATYHHLGYYVCYYLQDGVRDTNPLSDDSLFVRFWVTLRVNVTVRPYALLGYQGAEFSIQDVDDVHHSSAKVYLASKDGSCYAHNQRLDAYENESSSDKIIIRRRKKGDDIVYNVLVSSGVATRIRFQLVAGEDTVIANSEIAFPKLDFWEHIVHFVGLLPAFYLDIDDMLSVWAMLLTYLLMLALTYIVPTFQLRLSVQLAISAAYIAAVLPSVNELLSS